MGASGVSISSRGACPPTAPPASSTSGGTVVPTTSTTSAVSLLSYAIVDAGVEVSGWGLARAQHHTFLRRDAQHVGVGVAVDGC
jgi:hypothetical protein